MYIQGSYALNLFCPNRQTLEVSESVKKIALTLRASKLPVFKVRLLWDLNLRPPRQPVFLRYLADAGVLGYTGEAEL